MRRQEFVILMLEVLLFTGGVAKATVVDADIYNSTTINSGEYGTVNIYDSLDEPPIQTTVTMTGGYVAGYFIHDSSTFDYMSGDAPWIVALDYSVVNVHSDYNTGFELNDNSKIFLHNGSSDFIQLLIVSSSAQLHIYGYDLVCTPGNSAYFIEGQWEDNLQEFRIAARYTSGITTQIFLHEIPEPTSILIFSFCALILSRKHMA